MGSHCLDCLDTDVYFLVLSMRCWSKFGVSISGYLYSRYYSTYLSNVIRVVLAGTFMLLQVNFLILSRSPLNLNPYVLPFLSPSLWNLEFSINLLIVFFSDVLNMFALIYYLVRPSFLKDSMPDIFSNILLSIESYFIRNPSFRWIFN